MTTQMNLDWNWFFTSFAQCGAALIGIIAAFIISKLLNESEKSDQFQESLDKLILSYEDLKKRINSRYFNWYNERTIEYSYDIGHSIRIAEFDSLDDSEKLNKLYEIEPSLFKDNRNLNYLNSRIKKLNQKPIKSGGIIPTIRMPEIQDIPVQSLWDKLSQEKELIAGLKIESELLIDKFKLIRVGIISTQRKLNPINTTIYILSIGFIFSVIYPLHFMPLETNHSPHISWSINVFINQLFSLKGLLLAILTSVIEGIFIYFLFLIFKIKGKYRELEKRIKCEYTEVSGYSNYFMK